MISFSEFAHILFTVIGNGDNTSAFTKTLFLNIIDYEDSGIDAVSSRSAPTYKAYYNGHSNITRLAKQINHFISKERFSEFIDNLPDEAIDSLCEHFQIYLPEIKYSNVGFYLSDLFSSIIKEAAETSAPQSQTKVSAARARRGNLYKEDVYYEAQSFCIRYEKELDLLPLCQIAAFLNPLHDHVRSIYTVFSQCNQDVKAKILELAGMPVYDFSYKEWINHYLEQYQNLVQHLALSSIPFLYDGGKYFHRAFERYSKNELYDPNPVMFSRPVHGALNRILQRDTFRVPLADYIFGYLQKDDTSKERPSVPPMDYLWDIRSLDICAESEITFWVCRFIIDSCQQLVILELIENRQDDLVFIDDSLLKTQEDLYYYALLMLYLTLRPR